MSDTDIASPPAGITPPALAADVTALQGQIDTLTVQLQQQQIENSNLQKARGGAQTLAAERERQLNEVQAQLNDASQLLGTLQGQVTEQTGQLETTHQTIEQIQAERDQATRQARVLTLAGGIDPNLVRILANQGVAINVAGDDDAAIITNLTSFRSSLQAAPGALPPASPETPPATSPTGSIPSVPSVNAAETQIAALRREKMELSFEFGSREKMASIDRQIEELLAG